MRSEFPARLPRGFALYYTPELSLLNVHALVLKSLLFLQGLSPAPSEVSVVEDWLDHDGLEFHLGTHPMAYLFTLAATPRSLFEGTPKDDFVYIRAESFDPCWTLRLRTDWDAEDREQIGDLQLAFAESHLSRVLAAFEGEISHGELVQYARTG